MIIKNSVKKLKELVLLYFYHHYMKALPNKETLIFLKLKKLLTSKKENHSPSYGQKEVNNFNSKMDSKLEVSDILQF